MQTADRLRADDLDIGNVVLYLLSYNRVRADDEIRTRDPHLGAVMR